MSAIGIQRRGMEDLSGLQGKIALQRFGYSLGKKLLPCKLDFQVCSRNRHFSLTINALKQGM
jgi:hypothetical protein